VLLFSLIDLNPFYGETCSLVPENVYYGKHRLSLRNF
jgi:hypothetical protein